MPELAPRDSESSDVEPNAAGEAPAVGEPAAQGDGRTNDSEAGVRESGAASGAPRAGAEGAGAEGAAADGAESEDGAGEAPVFLNRAARRSRSKGGAPQYQVPGRGGSPAGRGPAQARRTWSNRRSGG